MRGLPPLSNEKVLQAGLCQGFCRGPFKKQPRRELGLPAQIGCWGSQ
jgi:hypothetical protein